MPQTDHLLNQLKTRDNVRILTQEETSRIYNSPIKRKILYKLEEEIIRSMRHLARRIGSDKTMVRDHLREMRDIGIIRLEDSTFHGAGCKEPQLEYDVIIPHPTTRRNFNT